MRHLCSPVKVASGGYVERTVCADEYRPECFAPDGRHKPAAASQPCRFREFRGKFDSKSKVDVRAVIKS